MKVFVKAHLCCYTAPKVDYQERVYFHDAKQQKDGNVIIGVFHN